MKKSRSGGGRYRVICAYNQLKLGASKVAFADPHYLDRELFANAGKFSPVLNAAPIATPELFRSRPQLIIEDGESDAIQGQKEAHYYSTSSKEGSASGCGVRWQISSNSIIKSQVETACEAE